MEFLLRYFVDGSTDCGDFQWEYSHAAKMIIPRIGERVWIGTELCVEVDMVTYSPNQDIDDTLYFVEIDCHDVTKLVLNSVKCEEDY